MNLLAEMLYGSSDGISQKEETANTAQNYAETSRTSLDPFEQFLSNAELGHDRAAKLTAEAQDIETRNRSRFDRTPETQRKAAQAEFEEEIGGDDAAHHLAKRYSIDLLKAGKKATTIKKLDSGWTMEYDERGQLIRGYFEEPTCE